MRTSCLLAAVVLTSALVAPGCMGTIIKEGAGVALGAKGTFMPIQPISADKAERSLAAYQRFELGPLTDAIGGKTPSDFLGLLPGAFATEIAKAKLPDAPGGKTMLIRGRIIHYESASTLGFVVGPLEEVIVLTEFVDKDTGTVLGVANCIGRTTERVNGGVQKKAEGLARAFVKWIDSRYPPREEE